MEFNFKEAFKIIKIIISISSPCITTTARAKQTTPKKLPVQTHYILAEHPDPNVRHRWRLTVESATLYASPSARHHSSCWQHSLQPSFSLIKSRFTWRIFFLVLPSHSTSVFLLGFTQTFPSLSKF